MSDGYDGLSGEPDEPEVIGYGVMYQGWMIQFDDFIAANKFAAKHRERIRHLVPAKNLVAYLRAKGEIK